MIDLSSVRRPIKVLTRARALLDNPKRWSRGASARDRNGKPVHPGDPTALSWDIEGALGICDNAVGVTPTPLLYLLDCAVRLHEEFRAQHVSLEGEEPEEAVWDYVAYEPIHHINDWCGHAVVLSLLDEAKEIAVYERDSGNSYYRGCAHLLARPIELHSGETSGSSKGG